MGYATETRGNAVTSSTLPFLFEAMAENGFGVLQASGEAVGLEQGQVGNSEVGHLTIGAGQAVPSTLRRIDQGFHAGTWARHPLWSTLKESGRLHVVGLLSDAGVHGHYRSIVQAASLAARSGMDEIFIHPVLDGVDSKSGSALPLLADLQRQIGELPGVRLGMLIGRRWFCDRSGKLDITKVFTERLAGREPLAPFSLAALQEHLATRTEADFPGHLFENGRLPSAGETILLTSHRVDRAVQVARALSGEFQLSSLVEIDDAVSPERVFFPPRPIDSGLGFELKARGIESGRIAEQCKFPHVTFFMNGFHEKLEGREVCVPSVPEASIGDHPEMSVEQVAGEIVRAIGEPGNRAVIANIANLDQVGHLGRFDVAVKAASHVNAAVGRIHAACQRHGWNLLITSDHGNADCVTDSEGRPHGSHTDRPVPFVALPARGKRIAWQRSEGSLANVAATFLAALELTPPASMAPALMKFSSKQAAASPTTLTVE